ARATHPQQIERRAEALRGAPRAPDEALAAWIGLDEREQALADRLGRVCRDALPARADELGGQALRAHLFGDLAQRHLAQRGEVLDAEEVVEGRIDALGGADLSR